MHKPLDDFDDESLTDAAYGCALWTLVAIVLAVLLVLVLVVWWLVS